MIENGICQVSFNLFKYSKRVLGSSWTVPVTFPHSFITVLMFSTQSLFIVKLSKSGNISSKLLQRCWPKSILRYPISHQKMLFIEFTATWAIFFFTISGSLFLSRSDSVMIKRLTKRGFLQLSQEVVVKAYLQLVRLCFSSPLFRRGWPRPFFE